MKPCEYYLFTCFERVKSNNHTSSSFEHFRTYDFLKLPYEVRHMIYELVIGVDQQIHIKSNLKADDIPMSIIPCSDHSPAACLQDPIIRRSRLSQRSRSSITVDRVSSYKGLHCQGTAFFSHVLHTSSRPDVHTMTVCYNVQSGEQKISSKDISSCNQSAPFEDQTTSSSRMDGLRLLRTCRQIYDEARLVLYKKNTFVFSNLATFAAYFGLALPTEVYMPRLTYPDRLRAIHSMTKVELRGNVADMSFQAVPFSTASRLVRMGLGCLTRLTSFELELGYNWEDRFAAWRIDDCLFSKPSSLKRLVVTLRNLEEWTFDKKEYDQPELFAMHQEVLAIAKELMRRMVKEEGFNDMEERFHDVKNVSLTQVPRTRSGVKCQDL